MAADDAEIGVKEYFDRRLDDLVKYMDRRFQSSDEAVQKAERTMNERLNSMNEFRDALRDQASRMATRVEMDKIDDNVQELRRAKANLDGRLLVMSGGVSIVVSVALWFLSHLAK
jgi:Arc/MetJ-type ribon-helix-helix transcriptional regulator